MASQTSTSLFEGKDDSSELDQFLKYLRPFIGNSDNDDLLSALFTKLKKDELKEKQLETAIEQATVKKDREPSHHILTQVSNVDQVIAQVKKAQKESKVLRVAGSEHAPAENIYPGDNGITLLLTDELRKITMLGVKEEDGEEVLYCKVGGGCYLGKNPEDKNSTVENGMCYEINANGFAFGITGGITQQSIGGYMTTGADGGTIKHSFAETVQDIEFVDGCGNLVTAKKGTDLWCAFGVSMGLMGIVTAVTFRLKKSFLVEGVQDNKVFNKSYLGPDPATGKSRLRESIENNEYFHMNWFPQKYVNRVMQWTGKKKAVPADIKPFTNELSRPLTSFGAAFTLYTTNRLLLKYPVNATYKIIGSLLKQFVPLPGYQNFCDVWYKTLPSDNQAPVDTLIKVDFTEIWLPLDQCDIVMEKLQNLYSENQEACGNFATEIYCAKQSHFWLSMSYGRDVVRVDPYWYHYNAGSLRKWFSYVWDVLLDVDGARCHWGKYIPENGQKCGNITFNLEFLKKSYPKMEKWLEMREQLDPHQIFVSDYWRKVFEIKPK